MHFVGNNTDSAQSDVAISRVSNQSPDVHPHFESTRVSLGTGDGVGADAPDASSPDTPSVTTDTSRSRVAGRNIQNISSIGSHSDLSVVAAYQSGGAKPK